VPPGSGTFHPTFCFQRPERRPVSGPISPGGSFEDENQMNAEGVSFSRHFSRVVRAKLVQEETNFRCGSLLEEPEQVRDHQKLRTPAIRILPNPVNELLRVRELLTAAICSAFGDRDQRELRSVRQDRSKKCE
jgi:hypothetical protein